MPHPPNAVAVLLNRHETRRAGGVPTVSVLVGPGGAGGRAWSRWADSTGLPVVRVHHPDDAPAAWVAELARRIDLPAAAVEAVAARLDRDPVQFRAEWRGKTAADVERFFAAVYPGPDSPTLRALMHLAAHPGRSDVAAFVAAVLPDNDARPWNVLKSLMDLAPSASRPAVLFRPPPGAEATSWLKAVAGGVAAWAAHLPAVPVALVVPAAAWEGYRASAPDTRDQAILREGAIEIPVQAPAAVERTLAEAGLPEAASAAAVLTATGATADLVASAVEAVRANIPPPDTPEADDRARSRAERFLFEILESLPETAGRFELNAALDFRFGPRAAEVDLLDRAGRLAVEIDGYFHFRGPDDYRRDRAKDYELQKRGFLVLRFLADDVVRQVEQVRERIVEAVTRIQEERP